LVVKVNSLSSVFNDNQTPLNVEKYKNEQIVKASDSAHPKFMTYYENNQTFLSVDGIAGFISQA